MPLVDPFAEKTASPTGLIDPFESDVGSGSGLVDPFAETTPTPAAPVRPASSILRRAVGDPLVAAAKGVVGIPEGVVGLANIPTLGRAGKAAEAVGIKFGETQDVLGKLYSPEAQEAQARVSRGFDEGIVPGIKSVIENPSTIVSGAIESVPGMLAGGGIAKKIVGSVPALAVAAKAGRLVGATPKAIAAAERAFAIGGGIGEGLITAGQNTEQVRREAEGGVLTPKQAALGAASGIITGLLGYAGGRVAARMGIADIDTLMAGGRGATKSRIMAIIGGMVSEGALEELPQSIQEQILQNVSLNKPWDEGVAQSGAMGAIIGGIMGAGANLRAGKPLKPSAPPAKPAPLPQVPPAAAPAPTPAPAAELQPQPENEPVAGLEAGADPADLERQQERLAVEAEQNRGDVQAIRPTRASRRLAVPGEGQGLEAEREQSARDLAQRRDSEDARRQIEADQGNDAETARQIDPNDSQNLATLTRIAMEPDLTAPKGRTFLEAAKRVAAMSPAARRDMLISLVSGELEELPMPTRSKPLSPRPQQPIPAPDAVAPSSPAAGVLLPLAGQARSPVSTTGAGEPLSPPPTVAPQKPTAPGTPGGAAVSSYERAGSEKWRDLPPGPERDAALSERAKAAREVVDSLKIGDVIVETDGSRLVVIEANKGMIALRNEASKDPDPDAGMVMKPSEATVYFIPSRTTGERATIERKPSSPPAPAATQPLQPRADTGISGRGNGGESPSPDPMAVKIREGRKVFLVFDANGKPYKKPRKVYIEQDLGEGYVRVKWRGLKGGKQADMSEDVPVSRLSESKATKAIRQYMRDLEAIPVGEQRKQAIANAKEFDRLLLQNEPFTTPEDDNKAEAQGFKSKIAKVRQFDLQKARELARKVLNLAPTVDLKNPVERHNNLQALRDFLAKQEALKAPAGAAGKQTVNANDLASGDLVERDGMLYKVAKHSDGGITLEDSVDIPIEDGEDISVDEVIPDGTRAHKDGMERYRAQEEGEPIASLDERLKDEDAKAASEAEANAKPAPPPLTLAQQTPEEVEAARAAAAKKQSKARMNAEAAKPLTAKEIDTTGDLLNPDGAANPLFAAPTPKPKESDSPAAAALKEAAAALTKAAEAMGKPEESAKPAPVQEAPSAKPDEQTEIYKAAIERRITNLEYRMKQDKQRSITRPENVAELADLKRQLSATAPQAATTSPAGREAVSDLKNAGDTSPEQAVARRGFAGVKLPKGANALRLTFPDKGATPAVLMKGDDATFDQPYAKVEAVFVPNDAKGRPARERLKVMPGEIKIADQAKYRTEDEQPHIGLITSDDEVRFDSGYRHQKAFGAAAYTSRRFDITYPADFDRKAVILWYTEPTIEEQTRVNDSLANQGIEVEKHESYTSRYNPSFRDSLDSLPLGDRVSATRIIRKVLGPDANVTFVDRIFEGGKDRLGKYQAGLTTIANRGDMKRTAWHEAYHGAEDMLMTDAERARAEELEPDGEKRADAFMEYAAKRDSFTGGLRAMFDRLMFRIKRLFGTANGIDELRALHARIMGGELAGREARGTSGSILQASNATVTAPGQGPQYMVQAFHGTPHTMAPEEGHPLGRFRKEKVGSGEGAAAYGWGVAYVAEAKGVAESYTKVGDPAKPYEAGFREIAKQQGRSNTVEIGGELLNTYQAAQRARDADLTLMRALTPEQRQIINEASKGNLYHVELNLDPEDTLDWDKPLSEQSEGTRILNNVAVDHPYVTSYSGRMFGRETLATMTGANLYESIAARIGKQAASEYLASLGIKGIRYADQGSRGNKYGVSRIWENEKYPNRAQWQVTAPNGYNESFDTEQEARADADAKNSEKTFNYVVFNEGDIRVVGRNGETLKPTEAMGTQYRRASQVTHEQDRAYMEAVERGDTAEAQRMVDEAAKAAGYGDSDLYHGSPQGDITEFYSAKGEHYFTNSEVVADFFTQNFNPYNENKGRVYKARLLFKNPLDIDYAKEYGYNRFDPANFDELVRRAKSGNHDGLILRDVRDSDGNLADQYVAFSPSQIKSADPITYDNTGKPVRLSERFNDASADIRYRTDTNQEGEQNENSTSQRNDADIAGRKNGEVDQPEIRWQRDLDTIKQGRTASGAKVLGDEAVNIAPTFGARSDFREIENQSARMGVSVLPVFGLSVDGEYHYVNGGDYILLNMDGKEDTRSVWKHEMTHALQRRQDATAARLSDAVNTRSSAFLMVALGFKRNPDVWRGYQSRAEEAIGLNGRTPDSNEVAKIAQLMQRYIAEEVSAHYVGGRDDLEPVFGNAVEARQMRDAIVLVIESDTADRFTPESGDATIRGVQKTNIDAAEMPKESLLASISRVRRTMATMAKKIMDDKVIRDEPTGHQVAYDELAGKLTDELASMHAKAMAEGERDLRKEMRSVYEAARAALPVSARGRLLPYLLAVGRGKPDVALAKLRDIVEDWRHGTLEAAIRKQAIKIATGGKIHIDAKDEARRLVDGTNFKDATAGELAVLLERLNAIRRHGALQHGVQDAMDADFKKQAIRNLQEAQRAGQTIKYDAMELATVGKDGITDLNWTDKALNVVKGWANGIRSLDWSAQGALRMFYHLDNFRDGAHTRTFKTPLDIKENAFEKELRPILSGIKKIIDGRNLNTENVRRIGKYAASQQEGGLEKLYNLLYDPSDNVDAETRAMRMIEVKKDADANARIVEASPGMMEFYNYARREFDRVRPRIREVLRRTYNVDMKEVDNYFSFMTDWAMTDEADTNMFVEQYDADGLPSSYQLDTTANLKNNTEKNFAKSRVGAGKQKINIDALYVFTKRLQDMYWFVHMGAETKRLGELANSKEYRAIAGKAGQKLVRQYIDLMARRGGTTGVHNIRQIDNLINNLGVGTLGFRVSTILIQPTSLLNAVGTIGHHAITGFADMMNPEIRKWVEANMPEVVSGAGKDIFVREAKESIGFRNIKQAGMAPMVFMDKITRGGVAWGAYKKYLADRGLKFDPANPIQEGITEAQRVATKTQATGHFKDAPLLMTRGMLFNSKTLTRMLLQFQTYPMNTYYLVVNDGIRTAIANKDYRKLMGIVAGVNAAFLAEGVVRQMLKAGERSLGMGGADDDDDKSLEEILAGNQVRNIFGSIPFAGSIIRSARYDATPAPVVEAGRSALSGLKTMATAKTPEARARGAVKMTGAAGSLTGLPGISQAAQWLKNSDFLKSDNDLTIGEISDSIRQLPDAPSPAAVNQNAMRLYQRLQRDGQLKPGTKLGQFQSRYREALKRRVAKRAEE